VHGRVWVPRTVSIETAEGVSAANMADCADGESQGALGSRLRKSAAAVLLLGSLCGSAIASDGGNAPEQGQSSIKAIDEAKIVQVGAEYHFEGAGPALKKTKLNWQPRRPKPEAVESEKVAAAEANVQAPVAKPIAGTTRVERPVKQAVALQKDHSRKRMDAEKSSGLAHARFRAEVMRISNESTDPFQDPFEEKPSRGRRPRTDLAQATGPSSGPSATRSPASETTSGGSSPGGSFGSRLPSDNAPSGRLRSALPPRGGAGSGGSFNPGRGTQPGARPSDDLSDEPSGTPAILPQEPEQTEPRARSRAPADDSLPEPGSEGLGPEGDRDTASIADDNCDRDKRACEGALNKLKQGVLSQIPVDIAVNGAEGTDFPCECTLGDETFAGRNWLCTNYTWKASGVCHKPLYFEDVQLERYGHSWNPVVQPFMSAAHFFVSVPLLPYHMGLQPPNECVYTLGYYRPGNCAPYMIEAFPISLRAALIEAGAIVGGIIAIP